MGCSLIVSHNTRVQCLLNLIKPAASNDKTRLKNCAIVRIAISKGFITVKMVYSGELGKKELKKQDKQPYYLASQ